MNLFDSTHQFAQLVRHQGVLFAFAIDARGNLMYRVQGGTVGADDDPVWSDAAKASVPSDVRAAGISLLTLPAATAQVSAAPDVPFQLVSDGKWIFLFRQSSYGSLLVNRYVAAATTGDSGETFTLQPAWEVRYQRSQNKDLPANNRDTFGYENLNGDPFIEPVLDLWPILGIQGGQFAVSILPNGNAGAASWQIVTASGNALQLMTIPRSDDGLFALGPFGGKGVVTPVARRTLTLSGVTAIETAPACLLYMQQEPTYTAGASGTTLLRSARFMVAFEAMVTGKAQLGMLDFGVTADATLAWGAAPGTLASSLALAELGPNDRLPIVAWDPVTSLSICGALLGFAAAMPIAPSLLDGADGLIHMYFASSRRGARGALTVAQFNPLVGRSVFFLPVAADKAAGPSAGSVVFSSTIADVEIGSAPVAITTSPGHPSGEICNLVLSRQSASWPDLNYTEAWASAPSDLTELVPILSGQAVYLPQDDDVIVSGTPFYDYYGLRPILALPWSSGHVWFLFRAQTATPLTASTPADALDPSIFITASTSGGKTRLTVALALTLQDSHGVAFVLQEVWSELPFSGKTNDLTEVLSGIASGKGSPRYDYRKARAYKNGVFQADVDLANHSLLATVFLADGAGTLTSPAGLLGACGSGLAVPGTSLQQSTPTPTPSFIGPPVNGDTDFSSYFVTQIRTAQTFTFTLEAWIQVAPQTTFPTSNGMGIFSFLYDANGNFTFCVLPTGQLGLNVTGNSAASSATGVNDGNWHHAAVSVTITSSGGAMNASIAFYVDGVESAATPSSLALGSSHFDPPTAGNPSAVVSGDTQQTTSGGYSYGGVMYVTSPIVGGIAEVRAWWIARTPEQIAQQRHVQLDDALAMENLAGYWRVDDGAPGASDVALANSAPSGSQYDGSGMTGWTAQTMFSPVYQGVTVTVAGGAAAMLSPATPPGSQVFDVSAVNLPGDKQSLAGLLGKDHGTLLASPVETRGLLATAQKFVGSTARGALVFSASAPGATFVAMTAGETLDFVGDLTIESWIQPLALPAAAGQPLGTSGSNYGVLLDYFQPQPSGAHARYSYSVGVQPLAALQFNGSTAWLELTNLPAPEDITIEVRLQVRDLQRSGSQLIIGKHTQDYQNVFLVEWRGSIKNKNNQYGIAVQLGDSQDDSAEFPLQGVGGIAANQTFVLAVVVQRYQDKTNREDKGSLVSLYINGAKVGDKKLKGKFIVDDPTNREWTVGQDWDPPDNGKPVYSEFFQGIIDEMRLWSSVRTAEQLAGQMTTPLTGLEPNLFTWLCFNEGNGSDVVLDHSTNRNDGALKTKDAGGAKPSWVASVWSGASQYCTAFAGGAEAKACSGSALIPTTNASWTHLAATYQSNYMIVFDGKASKRTINCGDGESLTPTQTLTIEAWVRRGSDGKLSGAIASKYGNARQGGSYALGIDQHRHVTWTVLVSLPVLAAEGDTNSHDKSLGLIGKVGIPDDDEWHYIVGVFVAQTRTDGDVLKPTSDVYQAIYVDGALDPASKTFKNLSGRAQIQSSDASFLIAGMASDTDACFDGRISGVRLWNHVLDTATVAATYRSDSTSTRTDGLVSYWPMNEGSGRNIADVVGGNAGTASPGIVWEPTSHHARWRLYVNGVEDVATVSVPYTARCVSAQAAQFTLGAIATTAAGAGQYVGRYNGALTDLRIWNIALSGSDLRAGLNTPPYARAPGLVGYWPIDTGSGTTIADATRRGNTGTLGGGHAANQPAWQAGRVTVPLRNEALVVKNVLDPDGLTFETQILTGSPSVAEYGALSLDPQGHAAAGAMDRCYLYPTSRGAGVTSAFFVGDLLLTYLGQVQFAPTLIGYIEGPPPVPSENLTRPMWASSLAYPGYIDASTIQIASSNTVKYAYSATRENGFDMSIAAKLLAIFEAGVTASAKVATRTAELKTQLGVSTKFDSNYGYTSGAQDGAGSVVSNTLKLGTQGNWEPPYGKLQQPGNAIYAYPKLGRRWIPANNGSALVRSGTADLYALSLPQTGAVVAYQIAKNPDIPEDWNIITFPIRSWYTQNGCLDGNIGFWAVEPATESYFRPSEAYAIKLRAEREAQMIEAYYAQFQAGSMGTQAPTGTLDDALKRSQPSETAFDWDETYARRTICNTYVWSALGGFYAEDTQQSAFREESLGGTYSFTGMGGLTGEASFTYGGTRSYMLGAFSFNWKIGGKLSFDALFGGHVKQTVTKTKRDENALQLTVTAPVDSYLYFWDPNQSLTTGSFSTTWTPGKVDGYRFMTIYQPPSSGSFDTFFNTVIDPSWLTNSSDPAARALRGARASKNGVWRVFHRVTYVSRVPPQSDSSLDRGLPKEDLQQQQAIVINAEDNAVLIDLVQTATPRKVDPQAPTWDAIARAVQEIKPSLPWQPALSQATGPWARLRDQFVNYLGLYYSLT